MKKDPIARSWWKLPTAGAAIVSLAFTGASVIGAEDTSSNESNTAQSITNEANFSNDSNAVKAVRAIKDDNESPIEVRDSFLGLNPKTGNNQFRLNSYNAFFTVDEQGSLIAKNLEGETLSIAPSSLTYQGVTYNLQYSVNNSGTETIVNFTQSSPENNYVSAVKTTTYTVVPAVNQQCALNNLLWGLGTGALTGGGAGPGGVVVGALTGAIYSGIQSATSC